LRRPIPGTPHVDGIGPWPYLWIEGAADIDALYNDFRDLVTLTVVTQPGLVPQARGDDAVLLKQHFIYDPSRPEPPLSRRARGRLNAAERQGVFTVLTDRDARMQIAPLYAALKVRRRLGGTYVDFSAEHFSTVAALEQSRFFAVTDAAGPAAMACGVVYRGTLCILHMVPTAHGLRWNASYLLMRGLQDFCREHGLRLSTGGMPDGAAEGLRIFKARWANHFEPVYLLRIVKDRGRYAALCQAEPQPGSYFPAYRAPRSTCSRTE
jgi:hypothetical protein